MLPVPDTNNPPGIILENNKDSDDDIIQVPISPQITPEASITDDDNNNNNDDNDDKRNMPWVQDDLGNPRVRDAYEVSANYGSSQNPGVKDKIAGVDTEISRVAQVIYEALEDMPIYAD